MKKNRPPFQHPASRRDHGRVCQAGGTPAPFITSEERIARRDNSPRPYFRLRDPLCRHFLEMAASPQEFDGLQRLFPFVREMSVFTTSRTLDRLPIWMGFAFMAGHDLGRAHPDFVDAILPGAEMRDSLRRLSIIKDASQLNQLTAIGLRRACEGIVSEKWSRVPEHRLGGPFLEATVKTLRTGYVAATVARADPVHCEFVWDIPRRTRDGLDELISRMVVGAPLAAIGRPIAERLEHPLIRLAREFYHERQQLCSAVQPWLGQCLRHFRVRSENSCPWTDAHLGPWAELALDYAAHLEQAHPELLKRSCGRESQELNNRDEVGGFKRPPRVNGEDIARLIARFKQHQETVHGWSEAHVYGLGLARVVYLVDFVLSGL